MTTIPEPMPGAQAPVSQFGRVAGVFFNPAETFTDIARRPSWLLPLVLMVLVERRHWNRVGQRVNWEEFLGRRSMLPPARRSFLRNRENSGLRWRVREALVLRLRADRYAVDAAIFRDDLSRCVQSPRERKVGLRSSQRELWRTPMNAVAGKRHTGDHRPRSEGARRNQCRSPLASSLYAFSSQRRTQWLQSLGSWIEIFFIWMLGLVAIGFATANPRKVTRAKAFGIVFGLWGAWVLGKVIWAVL